MILVSSVRFQASLKGLRVKIEKEPCVENCSQVGEKIVAEEEEIGEKETRNNIKIRAVLYRLEIEELENGTIEVKGWLS